MAFTTSHNLIDINQHSFMHGRSTCSQLLETQYDWWCFGMDIFDVITIDFRKAFNVVPHNMLVSKLADLGVCRQTLLWLAAFLSERQQRMLLNGRYSTPSNVTSDVIQGSVLGPLLFTFMLKHIKWSACRVCWLFYQALYWWCQALGAHKQRSWPLYFFRRVVNV